MAEWVATSGLESSWNQPALNCKACGQEGHEEASCPGQHTNNEKDGSDTGVCFNCGQTGHRAADCTAPRDNTCRYCKAEGHMIRDCPQKPPMVCGNCGQEGHLRKNCENSRLINRDHIADVTPDDALEKIKSAASERDVDDVKEAVQEYIKSVHGEVNYHELQNMFINQDVNLWLIATERQLVNVFTNMDLQGNTGKKYTISYRFSEKPERPREIEGWPKSRAELLDRLHDAGEVVDSGQIRCHICREVGHAARFCTQERAETNTQPAISCSNCAAEGHRLRDCPEPRVDKSACRNCGKSGHRASDCEEPPNLDNVECRKCGEKGHFGKDCPQGGSRACHNCGQDGHMSKECDQPRNMANVTCRNCDQTGHMSRECPQPTDWSKVQCSNCKQFGHTHVRCKEPIADEGMGFGGAGETSNDQTGASGWNSGGGNVGDIPAMDSAW